MSEYQYYEFQAIDRPLTLQEQQAVARLSSRVEPHPRRAVFVYNWSDFPAREQEILAQYYDAMLYLTNWGSRRLMFRYPQGLVDPAQLTAYSVATTAYESEAVRAYARDKHVILDIQLHEEESSGWMEGQGCLDALVGLREAVLRQDYRLLYLAWLKGLTLEYDADHAALEPPVPPGLGTLTPALESFSELFDVDPDLIQVAAARSAGRARAPSEDDLHRAIGQLPQAERDAFLLRLAQGEPHLSLTLNRRLDTLNGAPERETVARRSVGELFAAAEALAEQRRRKRAAKAEARRIAALEALTERKEETWRQVDALIQESKAKAYDEAVALLKQLQELAEYQAQRPAFEKRLAALCEQYSRRHSLMRRLRQVGLIET